MKKLIGGIGAALAAAGALFFGGGKGNAAPAPEVVFLQQAGDSAQIEVAWGAASSNREVTYTVEITTELGLWTRYGAPTLFLADTLWVPVDSVDVEAFARIRATAGGKTSASQPRLFIIPATVILGPPGQPSVKIISAIGMTFDAAEITVAAGAVLEQGESWVLPEGETLIMTALGWKASGSGPIAFACVELNGTVGWQEFAPLPVGGGYGDVDPGLFIPDKGCGWEWSSTNPTVATVTTGSAQIGAFTMRSAATVYAVPGGGGLNLPASHPTGSRAL